jgi:hypothetical protein
MSCPERATGGADIVHAWVQTVNGADVAEPSSTRAYTPVLTIGGPHHHPR